MKDRKGIGGRPRHGADVKKAPLNMRTDAALRAKIEMLAQRDGISLTQEVERLLRLGLERDAA
jgi:predicted HicB family RNase H-like nuclease